MMENKKNLGIIALILSIIGIIMFFITSSNIDSMLIEWIIALVLEIIAIILGFISKEHSKGISISSIIIGFITSILLILSITGLSLIRYYAKDCVDNGNGTSTCKIIGQTIDVDNNLVANN